MDIYWNIFTWETLCAGISVNLQPTLKSFLINTNWPGHVTIK